MAKKKMSCDQRGEESFLVPCPILCIQYKASAHTLALQARIHCQAAMHHHATTVALVFSSTGGPIPLFFFTTTRTIQYRSFRGAGTEKQSERSVLPESLQRLCL